MAHVKAAEILTRLREVLVEGAGTRRTISVGRFKGDAPAGLSTNARLQRAIANTRVEPSIADMRRSPSSPTVTGSVQHFDLFVHVRVERVLTRSEQLDDDLRDALRGLAIEDGDVIAQAFSVAGQLSTTQAAAATDICGGVLRFVRTRPSEIRDVDDGAQLIETIHEFEGIALARPS